jgi:hypothetical protein
VLIAYVMLRASHKTRDLPCAKVSVEVQLGVSAFNLYIPISDKAKVVEHVVQVQYMIHICRAYVLL